MTNSVPLARTGPTFLPPVPALPDRRAGVTAHSYIPDDSAKGVPMGKMYEVLPLWAGVRLSTITVTGYGDDFERLQLDLLLPVVRSRPLARADVDGADLALHVLPEYQRLCADTSKCRKLAAETAALLRRYRERTSL